MTPDPRTLTPSAPSRWRAAAPAVALQLAVVLIAGGMYWATSRDGDRGSTRAGGVAASPSTTAAESSSTTTSVPAALADLPWYPKFAADDAYANTWLHLFQKIGYNKFRDGGIPGMNIEDGHRWSWTPPACTCPKMTLWIYGSASVFGLNQRDDFTIPSALSKLAWSKGISLTVVNKGVPGDPYWFQADRFAWDVTGSTPPDMVAFYVGVSDLNAGIALDQQRLGDRDWPDDLFADGFMNDPITKALLDRELRGGKAPPPAPPGVRVVTPKPAAKLDPEGIGRLAVTRLTKELPMGVDVAELHHVTPFVFWEPMRLARPLAPGEPTTPNDADLKAMIEAAIADLPPGVINLSHAFDDNDKPLFFDDLHTNELGARLAAEAIYEHLAPTIATLAQQRGG